MCVDMLISDIEKIPVVDKPACLERLGGDDELYQEILSLYIEDAPNLIKELKKEICQDSLSVAERHAHSLKSASANVGAERLRATALEMELNANKGIREELKPLLDFFEQQFEIFKNTVK